MAHSKRSLSRQLPVTPSVAAEKKAPGAGTKTGAAVPAPPGPTLEIGLPDPDLAAKPRLAAVAPATAAQFRKVPPPVKMHASQVYPHLGQNLDPATGSPLPPRQRSGGQFSALRVCLVNQFNPTAVVRYIAVANHIESRDWPIASHERISNPAEFPGEDKEPGVIELLFDFEDQYAAFMKSFGQAAIFDPLAKNDIPVGTFPPGVSLPSEPPG